MSSLKDLKCVLSLNINFYETMFKIDLCRKIHVTMWLKHPQTWHSLHTPSGVLKHTEVHINNVLCHSFVKAIMLVFRIVKLIILLQISTFMTSIYLIKSYIFSSFYNVKQTTMLPCQLCKDLVSFNSVIYRIPTSNMLSK